jgi:chorismate dehydratase
MSKMKISVVSYLNSLPFRHALQNYKGEEDWEVQIDIPSVCADKLISGKVDIGLIPVAEIDRVPNARIISNYCIAADGPVKSVLLLSEVPLSEIEIIMLDYQSRTSVKLCRLLADLFWNIKPLWENTKEGYEYNIKGKRAAVVIGDRAIALSGKYKYVYDLSGEWKKYKGLPFVFACWVENKAIDKKNENSFGKILEQGVKNKVDVLNKEKIFEAEKRDYILNTIQYEMSDRHKLALGTFLDLSKKFI